MDLLLPLDRPLTIRARPIKRAGASLPGVVAPARKYLWYYIACWPDGALAASLHLGEGVVPAGETEPWRVMRRDRTRTLLRPTPQGAEPAASLYPGGSGLTSGAVFGRRAGHGAARHVERALATA